MGCGSSSLKGEKVDDIKADQLQPIKKVRTNFTEVDFTGESGHRRGTVAVAPDEQRRPTRVSETAEADGILQPGPDLVTATEQPHKPIEGETELGSPTTEPPALVFSTEPSTADQPSEQTKDTTSDPQVTQSQAQSSSQSTEITGLSTQDDQPRRKSWFARFGDTRKDKSTSKVISDQDLLKTTGMTRAEFDVWKEDPKNKVGRHQMADDGTHGASSGAADAS